MWQPSAGRWGRSPPLRAWPQPHCTSGPVSGDPILRPHGTDCLFPSLPFPSPPGTAEAPEET